MNDYISWGQEYLDEAERIKRRLLVIRAERDYDIAGEQAQRVQMLYTMYLECLVTRPCAAKARKEGGFVSGYKPLSAGARQAKLLSRIGAETNKNELLEAQVLLRRAIGNELTDRQRDCVQLYYGERLTMQEIADELHLTRGTVCKHLQKASARLSHALQYSALGMRAEQSRDR